MKFTIEVLNSKSEWKKKKIEAKTEEEAMRIAARRKYCMSSYTGSVEGFVDLLIKSGTVRPFRGED